MVYAEFILLKEATDRNSNWKRGWAFYVGYAGAALCVIAAICCWIAFCVKPKDKKDRSVYYRNTNLTGQYDNPPELYNNNQPGNSQDTRYANTGFNNNPTNSTYDVPARDYPMDLYGDKKMVRIR